MDVFLAQDWITLSSASAGTIVQSERGWLDLGVYRDVVAWLDVKGFSSSGAQVAYQSAVAKEESLFATMGTSPSPLTTNVSVTPMLCDLQAGGGGAAPLARWFRWQTTLGAGDSITFRLWIAANKPGRAGLSQARATR